MSRSHDGEEKLEGPHPEPYAVFAEHPRRPDCIQDSVYDIPPVSSVMPLCISIVDHHTVDRYFNRYKDGIRSYEDVPKFMQELADWFEIWASDVTAVPPRFQDPITAAPEAQRRLTISHIREEIDRLIAIVQRESGVVLRLQKGPPKSTVTHEQRSRARIAQLAQTYDPPGELRPDGVRHDNDFVAIEQIRIAPTHSELFSPVAPYMPVFSPEAPHHLPAESMERHLDIQFRLLREELM